MNFLPDNIETLHRHLADADREGEAAKSYLNAVPAAQSSLAAAQDTFVVAMGDKTAAAVVVAANRLREAQCIAAAIETAGGPAAIRRNVLNRPAPFVGLALAYEQRVIAIDQTLARVRKALAARRSELTEAGADLGRMEGDPHVMRLRSAAWAMEQAAHAAQSAAAACRRSDYTTSYETHLSLVCAPLPAFPALPPLPSLEPVAA